MSNLHPDKLPPDLSRLRHLLVDYFDLSEIRTLCLDLGVRYDDLGGEGITAKVRELLLYLDRTKRMDALLQRVESLRPKVDWRGGPLPEAICPYKGLHAFGKADKDNFFGRDEFTKKLTDSVSKQSLVAVVGPSGSGKSSVVFAGLLPALDRVGSWLVVNFRPGNDPFLALAKALVPILDPTASKLDIPDIARHKLKPLLGGENKAERIPLADYLQQIQEEHPDKKLLLIIDQFEELYTQVEQAVRRDFLDVMLAAGFSQSALVTPTHTFATLLLTMRADFMGQALAYPPMVAALQDNDVKIGLMSKDELALAIEQPALNQGVRFADGLVTRILEDVGDHAGNLPLLEFALTLLWERQTHRQMTHDAYEAIGGVSGALTQHADETLAKLTQNDTEKVQAIQRVMVQLVQPGAGAEDTRRVARRADLGDAGWTLAQRLAAEDARLLVTGRDNEDAETTETVEVIHEALIQNWGQLQEWMETDREFRMWQERLRSDLALWQKNEKQKGYLLQGAPLTLAEEWLEKRRDALSLLEVEYIQASLRKRKGDNFRRIGTALVVAVLLIGASILVAVIQSQAATNIGIEATKGAIAEENAEAAATTSAAAAATSDHNESLARESEEDAQEAKATAEANERLANARWLVSQGQEVFNDDPLLGLILVLEGLTLVIPESQKMSEVEFETFQENIMGDSRKQVFQWGRFLILDNQVQSVDHSPSGSLLLIDYSDASGQLRNSADGFLIVNLPGVIDKWEFSPDGDFFFIDYFFDVPGELRNGNDGSLISILTDEVQKGEFSSSGNLLLVDYHDSPSELRDSTDGSILATFPKDSLDDHPDVLNWEVNPDGGLVLIDFFQGPDGIRDTEDGSLISDLSGDVDSWEFSPNGKLLLVDYFDVPDELRDAEDGTIIVSLPDEIDSWNFSKSSSLLLIDYLEEKWELRNGEDGSLISSEEQEVFWEFSPNGKLLLIGYFDAEGEIRNGEDGSLISLLGGEISAWDFNADGSLLLIDYDDEYGELRDGEDGSLIISYNVSNGFLYPSPKGNLVLSISETKEPSLLLNGEDGSPIASMPDRVGAWGFGEGLLAVGYLGDTPNELYDLTDGSLVARLQNTVDNWGFSFDGSLLLVDYLDPDILDELRDGGSGSVIVSFENEISYEKPISFGNLIEIDFEDGSTNLLKIDEAVALAPLGTNMFTTEYVLTTQILVARYQDGRAYLIDLAWLQAMNGEVETLPVSKLIQIACEYPLDNGAVLSKPEVRVALEPYLQQVGLEAPQACQPRP